MTARASEEIDNHLLERDDFFISQRQYRKQCKTGFRMRFFALGYQRMMLVGEA